MSAVEDVTDVLVKQADVILTIGARVIPVLMQTTRTVPIVIPGGANPVERHLTHIVILAACAFTRADKVIE